MTTKTKIDMRRPTLVGKTVKKAERTGPHTFLLTFEGGEYLHFCATGPLVVEEYSPLRHEPASRVEL